MDYSWLTMTYCEDDRSGMYLWTPERAIGPWYSIIYHEFPSTWEAAVVKTEVGRDDMGADAEDRDTEDLPFNWIFG